MAKSASNERGHGRHDYHSSGEQQGQAQENDGSRNTQPLGTPKKRTPAHSMKVHFCDQAKEQLKAIDEEHPELQGKAAEMHEEYIREYAEQHCPDARRANVRKIAHEGGTSHEEPEHATVSFKGPRSVDPKGRHVYMDFWARFLGSKKD